MNHLDLFSGIGGFAYAVDQVWPGSTHIFCDNNLFCQQVIRKHWPESRIYGDIRTITNTDSLRPHGSQDPQGDQERNGSNQKGAGKVRQLEGNNTLRIDLLTGGFPCQPFSQAGKRRGTADDRYLWPEMLRVIQLTKPTWIIGENVGGFVTWNEGMVLEQVCLDMETEGYEVQPFIIPACAVNAPHRRDRVWIVAHRQNNRGDWWTKEQRRQEENKQKWENLRDKSCRENCGLDWETHWLEVATRLCRMDDGLPKRVDRLRALGNAIVPQVAIEIMKAINYAQNH